MTGALLTRRQGVQLGLVRSGDVPLDIETAEGGAKPSLSAAPVSGAAGK